MKLLEFFQESNGRLSNVRLMSFIMLLVSVFIAINSVYMQIDHYVFLISVVSAFAPKVIQKFIEVKK